MVAHLTNTRQDVTESSSVGWVLLEASPLCLLAESLNPQNLNEEETIHHLNERPSASCVTPGRWRIGD